MTRGPCPVTWSKVSTYDARARALADRHYSRQKRGTLQFMPPGRRLVLLTDCARAVWGVVLNLDPCGVLRWRCSLFRNEGAGLSSDLIRAATSRTFDLWGARPPVPLTTEIDPERVRRKRDPGRCFRRAGWICLGYHVRPKRTRGHWLFAAPGELERCNLERRAT